MYKNDIKVSIIIPVYNAEKYLQECLNSVVAQTLEEIECICINDGSTDNSLEILKLYESNPKFVIINKKNEGVSVARNAGIKVAKGEYIMFLDSDDYLVPEACYKAYKAINESDKDICVFGYSQLGSGRLIPARNRLEEFENRNDVARKEFLTCAICIWDKIWRKKFLQEHSVEFPVGCKTAEDVAFNWICYLNGATYAALSVNLYVYRCDNVTQATNSSHNIAYDLETFKYLRSLPIFESSSKELQLRAANVYMDSAYNYLTKLDAKDEQKILIKDLSCLLSYMEGIFSYKDLMKLKLYRKLKYIKFYRFLEFFYSTKKSRDKAFKIITLMGFRFQISRK